MSIEFNEISNDLDNCLDDLDYCTLSFVGDLYRADPASIEYLIESLFQDGSENPWGVIVHYGKFYASVLTKLIMIQSVYNHHIDDFTYEQRQIISDKISLCIAKIEKLQCCSE